MHEARSRRIRPHLDDKVLTSWNGLMISALARAGRALDEPRYAGAAGRAARFLLTHARTPEGRLLHRWRDGDAAVPAFLDDYAFLIDGLIELYQTDFDPAWFGEAVRLQKIQDDLFADGDGGGYFFTDGTDRTLQGRQRTFTDSVEPSGNSVSALNLLRLSALTGDPHLQKRADGIFEAAAPLVARAPTLSHRCSRRSITRSTAPRISPWRGSRTTRWRASWCGPCNRASTRTSLSPPGFPMRPGRPPC